MKTMARLRGLKNHGFSREADMLDTVLLWLARQGLHAKTEFVTPWGVCDVVATAFPSRKLNKRLRLGQTEAIGPTIRIELLYAIPSASYGRSISLNYLQEQLQTAADDLRPHLVALVDRGFVRETRPNRFQQVDAWALVSPQVVAIELKLDRVEEALDQAVQNQGIAHQSFIAVPHAVGQRILLGSTAETVARLGIGVLGVAETGCSVLRRPSKDQSKVNPVLARHCVERFWRSHSKAIDH
jgi:hypothetical protein